MYRVPVRVTAGTGLIGGGLLFAIWSVGGVSITWLSVPMTNLVFFLSYASLAIGFVSMGLLARRTDDAISPAVTALGLGFLLLTPVILIHLVGQQSLALASIVPFDTIILSVVVVGLLVAVFGAAILAGTLVPTPSPSKLVGQPWARLFVALLGLGTLGWALSYPLYESTGITPVGFPGPITPYTQTGGAANEVAAAAFVVFSLAFCLLGMILLTDSRRSGARDDYQWTS